MMKFIPVIIVIFVNFTVKCDEENEAVVSRSEKEVSIETGALQSKDESVRTVDDTKEASRSSEETRVLRSPFNRALIDEAELDQLFDTVSSRASDFENNASEMHEVSARTSEDKTEEVNIAPKSAEIESKKASEKEESKSDELLEHSRSASDSKLEKEEDRQQMSSESKLSENEKSGLIDNVNNKIFSAESNLEDTSDDSSIYEIHPNRRMLSHRPIVVDTKARSGLLHKDEEKTVQKPTTKPYNLDEFGSKNTAEMNNYPLFGPGKDIQKLIHKPAQVPIQIATPHVRKLSQDITNQLNLPNYYQRHLGLVSDPIGNQFQGILPVLSERRHTEMYQKPQHKIQSWPGSPEITNGLSQMGGQFQQLTRDATRTFIPKLINNLSQERLPNSPTSYPRMQPQYPDMSQTKPQTGFIPVTPEFKNLYYKLAQASDFPRRAASNTQSSETLQKYPDRFTFRYYDPNHTFNVRY